MHPAPPTKHGINAFAMQTLLYIEVLPSGFLICSIRWEYSIPLWLQAWLEQRPQITNRYTERNCSTDPASTNTWNTECMYFTFLKM